MGSWGAGGLMRGAWATPRSGRVSVLALRRTEPCWARRFGGGFEVGIGMCEWS